MRNFRYTQEQKDWLYQAVQTMSGSKVAEEFSKLFFPITKQQVKAYRSNNHIHAKVREPIHQDKLLISGAAYDFLIEHKNEYEAPYMAKLLNENYGLNLTARQVKQFKHNHGIKTNLTGAYNQYRHNSHKGEKGWCIPNSENTRFKKGEKTEDDWQPVYTVRKRPGAGNYLYIKVAQPNTWIMYHRYIWEKANGPLKPGEKLKFLNGDTTDCRLENLMIYDNQIQGMCSNKGDTWATDPDINKAKILTAKIQVKIKEKREQV